MKANILVTGIGGGGHGEQILKSLKLIEDIDLTIIGTDISEFSTGKTLVNQFYVVPRVTESNYKDVVFNIIKKHNISFVFHGSEAELKFISEHRSEFERIGVGYPLNSKEVISLCMNKFNTYVFLKEKGIALPKFKKLTSLSDISEIDFYPLVLKPSTGSGGSADVYLVFDEYDCKLLVEFMLRHNVDIVAQEYIGTHENEYTIGVSSDKNGNILGSIVVKRIINNALSTNKKLNGCVISSGVSQGHVCHREDLQKQAEHIARVLDSRGPLNIQCREVDGKLMLFEINPRLSGTTSLRAMAGYNEPEIIIKNHIFGEVQNISYRDMLIMRTIKEVII